MPLDYHINRTGTVVPSHNNDKVNNYYLQNVNMDGYFLLISLEPNQALLVKFPDRMNFFDRYSGIDTGGMNNGVLHGKGDHYLLANVAAALFGVAAVLKDTHSIHISFGDMSADNGSDPWSPGSVDHAGHGHGSRSGLDVDFRYIDNGGYSFHGKMNNKNFSKKNNEIVYQVAETFGFKKNYQGKMAKLSGIPTAGGHDDHGHLGFGS